MSKLAGLHTSFFTLFQYTDLKWVFVHLFSPGLSGDVKNESDKAVGHRGRLDQATIHG